MTFVVITSCEPRLDFCMINSTNDAKNKNLSQNAKISDIVEQLIIMPSIAIMMIQQFKQFNNSTIQNREWETNIICKTIIKCLKNMKCMNTNTDQTTEQN